MKTRVASEGKTLPAAAVSAAERVLLPPGYPAAAKYAAGLLAMIFGVAHTMVLQYLSGGDWLLLQEGVGWPLELLGQSVFEYGVNTLAGFTLSSETPVIIEDLQVETRFPLPKILLESGLVSGLCTRVTFDRNATGMLAIFSKQRRQFDKTELEYINAVAGLLSSSMGNRQLEDASYKDKDPIEQAKQEWEATVDALPHVICLLDEHGRIVRANRSVELWVPGVMRDIRGHTIHDVLHPDCHDPECYMLTTCANAMDSVRQNRHVVFEAHDKILKRKLEIQLRPTSRRHSAKTSASNLVVMLMYDITRIKNSEELLKYSNTQLEDLVRERTNELSQINEQLWCEILERRRIVEELRQSENDMHLLSAQLLTAQEMERKRIAAELHDGISQSLTAIKFSIESAVAQGSIQGKGQRDTLIEKILTRIQTAIEEVHQISTNLRPSMLDDLGIIPTIAWFCREFRSIYKDIDLETYIDIAEDVVPDSLKTVIYRVLQEALNNIVRHSEAKHVVVYLGQQDSTIRFQVKDNGQGFEPGMQGQRTQGRMGSGLGSMRERTEFSGGSFSIQSSPGAGTTIRALWPIHS